MLQKYLRRARSLAIPDNYSTPLQSGQWGSKYNTHTPDYYKLERKNWNWVFIYDDMMRGQPSYKHIENGLYYADCFTQEHFLMFRNNLGKNSQSVVLRPKDKAPGMFQRAEVAPIRGELHALRSYDILQLDRLLDNGVQFHRVRVKLDIPHFVKYETAEGGVYSSLRHDRENSAMMYIGDHEHWTIRTFTEKDLRPGRMIEAKVPYYHHGT